MEKIILMEFMNSNCVGYENRLTGREIEAQTGISYKVVSNVFLNNLDLNVVNCGGYFICQESDIKILEKKQKKLESKYNLINKRVKQIKRIKFDLDCNKML